MSKLRWVKATESGSGGNCAEMARDGSHVLVRDSKDPDGHAHRFTLAEFAAWLDGAKRGEFDHLLA